MTPPIDFSKPNNNSDRVFVIEGKHLHVNSQVLGVFSTFFDRLFNGEFSDAAKEVIPLDGINYEEFVELLQTIYPSQNSIRVGNVESLLALSDRFDIPSVFIKCEQFLLNSPDVNKIDLFLRLDWASRYCMPELQNHLLLSLTTMDAICKASESPAWRNMCEAAKTGLLLTVFRVHKGPNAMPPHFF
ncbi:unnamed protein product [Caenorhabditis auriculariae]|uniref:BTB domain-containing protein n=1 Tax=Caenorhabditis auriculariae TaxID=2777116 RepID=A0A8S1HF33_9PELO|nr:unnamed protein product [Caenorhabditis auriculariae]